MTAITVARRSCLHVETGNGPRLPLLFGSAATEVCKACGMWRDARKHQRWRPAAELLISIATRDDDEY